MKNYLLILVLLLLLLSCSKNESQNFIISKNPPKINIENNYEIVLDKTIEANLYDDISSKSYYYKLFQDSLLYFAYNKNKLALLNISTEKIEKIDIPDYLIKTNIYGIEPINKDSIFIIESYPPAISLIKFINDSISFQRKYLKKIDIKTNNKTYNDEVSGTDDSEANYNIDENGLLYNKNTGFFHIGLEAYDFANFPGFEDTPQIGVYNWNTDSWVSAYAPPQGLRRNKKDKSYGRNSLSKKKFLIKGDTTYVNSKLNHGISLYKGNSFLKNIPFSSTNSKPINEPLTYKASNEIENVLELLHTTPKYHKLFYHEKVKLFSRIYLDKQNYLNEHGKKNNDDDRDAYIIFMDENFNLVGEFELPKNSFESRILSTSDGFLMFANKHDESDPKDEFFPLRYKYTIKKIQ